MAAFPHADDSFILRRRSLPLAIERKNPAPGYLCVQLFDRIPGSI